MPISTLTYIGVLKNKKKVLVFIDWFYPAYKAGGPIKSIYHIAENLSKHIEFYVFCSNRDLDGEVQDVITDQWIEKEHFKVKFSSHPLSKKGYNSLFDEVKPQVLYFNNLFSLNYTIKPLWFYKKYRVKTIIAPRGMLGKGALKLKASKKKLYLLFAKQFLFSSDFVWHASTNLEESEIRDAIGEKSKIKVAQNLSSKPIKRNLEKMHKEEGELKLVFISRVSEKKNLLFILDLFNKFTEQTKLTLDIFGPIEDENYWRRAKAIIGLDKRIKYKGILKPTEINSTLINYHFFVLPTLHENFGHAIAESINMGVPVILSKNTPWRNLEESKVGFDIELNNNLKWVEKLKQAIAMDTDQYKTWVAECFEFANRNIVNNEALNANKKLFTDE